MYVCVHMCVRKWQLIDSRGAWSLGGVSGDFHFSHVQGVTYPSVYRDVFFFEGRTSFEYFNLGLEDDTYLIDTIYYYINILSQFW